MFLSNVSNDEFILVGSDFWPKRSVNIISSSIRSTKTLEFIRFRKNSGNFAINRWYPIKKDKTAFQIKRKRKKKNERVYTHVRI